MENRLRAFTLAEVLITLGIIGVVAALTIPTLIQNANEKATVTALKKAYSVLSQAYALAVIDNGTPDTWNLANGDSAMIVALAPYLKITKNCSDGSGGCFPSGVTYQAVQGGDISWPSTSWAELILSDGSFIFANTAIDSTCKTPRGSSQILQGVCGEYFVDINGGKKPNQYGKDMFEFYLAKDGIVPEGSQLETSNTFASACALEGSRFGWGCSAWVIYHENMDYLKCSGLSWGGKTKCN